MNVFYARPQNEIYDDYTFLDYMRSWVEHHIKEPIQGFDQKKDRNGKFIDTETQLSLTHKQILHAACYFYERGKSLPEILAILTSFKK